jgi:type IV pilus assembly protein PilE
MKRQSGFTLLELMIVLVIVGILASIAIPSYRDSIRKGNRRAAQAVLMDIANRERQYSWRTARLRMRARSITRCRRGEAGKYTSPSRRRRTTPTFTIDFTAGGSQAAGARLVADQRRRQGSHPGEWLP